MYWVSSFLTLGTDGLLLVALVVVALLIRKSPKAAGCVVVAALIHLLSTTAQFGFFASDLLPYSVTDPIQGVLYAARSAWGYVAYLLFAVQWLLMVTAAFLGRDA